ncbi:TetR/AcrR family transcriptional regulator [Polymorphospora rubra]|uniref:Putative transcriptional regulator, TetR n=1 Tax=Polymorphospora rubra TaxID=338584 RepID=A0A810MVZ9_9ACTN|nr:TetR/AcrR family transcriptional regulator [Polymorphospora rubra]BCJ63605.1 putative transcriptional regulator, TetR [Polymorphospora rubra]
MPSRQDQLLDAAISVLGTGGPRNLTHRAVDAQAGLPAGSASNHFRTREALLAGIVTRLVELDRVDWQGLAATVRPRDVDELAGALADFVRYATGPGRHRTLARYALSLEAAVRPALQAELRRGQSVIVGWGVVWLRALGSTDPARDTRLVMDHLDGVMLHELSMPVADFDPRPGIRAVLAGILGR